MEGIKRFIDWIGRYQVVQSILAMLKPILLPAGFGLVTAFAGFFGKAPIMWIVMASTLAFMAVIVSMVFLENYVSSRTPAHKLRYVATVVAADLATAPNRKKKRTDVSIARGGPVQAYLDKVQIGVQLQNTAGFPVSAFMEAAETRILDKEPPRTKYPKKPVTIMPGNIVNMTDLPINMDDVPCGKMDGHLDITIKYGRAGKEKFELHFKAKLEVFMRRDGLTQLISTAWDSNRVDVKGPPA